MLDQAIGLAPGVLIGEYDYVVYQALSTRNFVRELAQGLTVVVTARWVPSTEDESAVVFDQAIVNSYDPKLRFEFDTVVDKASDLVAAAKHPPIGSVDPNLSVMFHCVRTPHMNCIRHRPCAGYINYRSGSPSLLRSFCEPGILAYKKTLPLLPGARQPAFPMDADTVRATPWVVHLPGFLLLIEGFK